jgi:hypothetical protein
VNETARYGWASSFKDFRGTPPSVVRGSLADFIRDASPEQVRAWDESIPPLQGEVAELIDADERASEFSAILEYELPLEFRRPDVVFLSNGSVYVLELKGKARVEQADLDQAAGYARDLEAYHAECHGRPVHPLLVLTRGDGRLGSQGGVHVIGLNAVDDLVEELDEPSDEPPIRPARFLAADAYSPLPTIVEASRELMESGELRRVHEAAMKTEPALTEITRIIHEAARTKTRRLVLLTGIPGAGKTLVGLQVAHARFLDDLVVDRESGKPTAPAVYLSGNGPLVQVLQYNLRSAGARRLCATSRSTSRTTPVIEPESRPNTCWSSMKRSAPGMQLRWLVVVTQAWRADQSPSTSSSSPNAFLSGVSWWA